MKTLKCLFVLLAFIGLLFIGCSEKSSPVASPNDLAFNTTSGPMSLGKMSMTTFTGTETTIDFAYGKDVGMGKGNRLVEKGVWFESDWSINGELEPLLDGAVVDYTFNVSFNASGEGPMQGKFTMMVGGGTLEGTVEGKMFIASDGSELQGIFSYVGHGKGGTIDGMKLSCTETYHEALDHYSYAYGDLVGYIK
jgi:hypothetical protein